MLNLGGSDEDVCQASATIFWGKFEPYTGGTVIWPNNGRSARLTHTDSDRDLRTTPFRC